MNTRIHALQVWLTAATIAAVTHLEQLTAGSDDHDRDRGDVPGWVMITVMTAIIVIALLAVFKTQMINAVTDAFARVSNAG